MKCDGEGEQMFDIEDETDAVTNYYMWTECMETICNAAYNYYSKCPSGDPAVDHHKFNYWFQRSLFIWEEQTPFHSFYAKR